MRRPVSIAVTIWGLSWVAVALAQQAPQPTFRGDVDIVRLDVSVLDKQRKPVEGLTAADFAVLEDGKPRPVVAFTAVKVPGPSIATTAAAWPANLTPDVVTNGLSDDGRLLVIAFDESIRPTDQAPARRIATAAVENLGAHDVAALVMMTRFANVGRPQNFTTNRHLLLDAIDAYHPGQPGGSGWGDCETLLWRIDDLIRLVDTMREEPSRRKIIMWIGYALPSVWRPEVRPSCTILNDLRKKLIAKARQGNVVINVADPSGLETSINSGVPISMERWNMLRILPEATGGRVVVNTNTPERLVPAILNETSSYYLVGFTPADPSRIAPHRIEVKVKPKGLTVNAPSGYGGPSVEPAHEDDGPLSAMDRAVSALRPDASLPLGVSVAPFANPGQLDAIVAVSVAIPELRAASPGTTAAASGPVKLVVMALTPRAKAVPGARFDAELDWPQASPTGSPHEAVTALALAPGHYEIRVAVDGGSRAGSVFTFVEVPDFSKAPLSLSGLMISALPATTSIRTGNAVSVLPFTPTLQRDFTQSDTIRFFSRVYQRSDRAALPVRMTARVIDAHGEIKLNRVTDLGTAAFVNASSDFGLAIPASALAPGEYLLTVAAEASENTVRRDLRFSIKVASMKR